MTTRQLPADSDVSGFEYLGVSDVATEVGMTRSAFSMAFHRHRKGKPGGVDFPEPHVTIGSCSMWIRTVEVQAAIASLQDSHR